VAIFMNLSPQYIRYFPLSFVITCLPFWILVTIEPDLQNMSLNLPWYAFSKTGPCLVQFFRSGDVATASLATFLFHCVYIMTYKPSLVTAIRGSSQPPGHSFSF